MAEPRSAGPSPVLILAHINLPGQPLTGHRDEELRSWGWKGLSPASPSPPLNLPAPLSRSTLSAVPNTSLCSQYGASRRAMRERPERVCAGAGGVRGLGAVRAAASCHGCYFSPWILK